MGGWVGAWCLSLVASRFCWGAMMFCYYYLNRTRTSTRPPHPHHTAPCPYERGDEDKHKAPHRTLSLRAGRSWFVIGTLIGRDKSRPYRPDEMRRPGRLLWQSTQWITARRIPYLM